MTDAVTNIVVEALPQFEGYVFPNEAIPHGLEHIDCHLSLHHRTGGGRLHHGLAGARVQCQGAGTGVSALDVDGTGVFALRHLAATVASGASIAVLRDHD